MAAVAKVRTLGFHPMSVARWPTTVLAFVVAAVGCSKRPGAGGASAPRAPDPWRSPAPTLEEASRCFAAPEDAGALSAWTWRVVKREGLVRCAYRSGTSLLEGEALNAIPQILYRALLPASRPGELYTDRINGIGLGPCAPLWDPDRPKGFLCILVSENRCSAPLEADLRSIVATLESELGKRALSDARTGVCLFLGQGPGVEATRNVPLPSLHPVTPASRATTLGELSSSW